MEHRFHEVPRDWPGGNCSSYRTPPFNEFSGKDYQNVHCVEVKLIISLQIPAFPDLS